MNFSDIPYGNLPLELPSQFGSGPPAGPDGLEVLVAEPDEAGTAIGHEGWTRDVTPARLFWFRWVTGHQVCFLCWRLAGVSLTASENPETDRDDELRRAAALLRGATAMFIYTASCPRGLYHSLIRPFMSLWHAAFTGRWAADYQPLPGLVTKLRTAPQTAAVREVERAFHESRKVHIASAQKLVPEGRSVLQQFVRAHGAERGDGEDLIPPESATFVYDSFFLVRRIGASQGVMVAELRERVAAILADLTVNGLYRADADSEDEIPENQHGDAFRSQQSEIPALLGTASMAVGVPLAI